MLFDCNICYLITQYFKMKTEKFRVIKLVFINFFNFFIDEKFFFSQLFIRNFVNIIYLFRINIFKYVLI